jgi:hypothetical protein
VTLTPLFVAIDAARWCARHVGTVLVALLLAAFAGLAWLVLPPYVRHYRFLDNVVELATAPTHDDARVHAEILRAADRLRIPLREDRLEVRLENNERIVRCGYEVPLTLLPSVAPWHLRFRVDVAQPAFARENAGSAP